MREKSWYFHKNTILFIYKKYENKKMIQNQDKVSFISRMNSKLTKSKVYVYVVVHNFSKS